LPVSGKLKCHNISKYIIDKNYLFIYNVLWEKSGVLFMYRYVVHPLLLFRLTIYGLRRSLKLTGCFYFKELCTEIIINRTASPSFRVKMEKLGNFFLPIAIAATAIAAYFNYLTDRTDYFAEIDCRAYTVVCL